jgi:hypothetical protein
MRAVLQLIVWTGLAHLALAGVLGLSVDESYTVAISRHLDLSAPASRPDWLRRAAPYFSRIEPGADVVLTRAGTPALTLHTAWGVSLRAAPHLPPAL